MTRWNASTLGPIVVLLAASFLTATPASASCGLAIVFNQGGYVCQGGAEYCYIVSPGVAEIDTLDASFWSLETGDPVPGLGDDVGTRANNLWLNRYTPTTPIYIRPTNNWSEPGIDGCIDRRFPTGHSREVMVVAFSDESRDGSTAFFATAAVERVPAAAAQFDFSVNARDIELLEIPAPELLDVEPAFDSVTVTLGCPELADAFYSDGTVEAVEVIEGCRIFRQELPRGATPPANRGSETGWMPIGDVIPTGASGQVVFGCAAGNVAWLATAVAFDSGFETGFVSRNVGPIDCASFLMQELRIGSATIQFREAGDDRFQIRLGYVLSADSDGIDPEDDDVTFGVGSFVETIPAGSFTCAGDTCDYEAAGPGITRAAIGAEEMWFSAADVDLTGTANPVDVSITIGNDSGAVTARFSGALSRSIDG